MTDARQSASERLGHALRASALRRDRRCPIRARARRRAGRGGAPIIAAIADNPAPPSFAKHDRGAGTGRRYARPGGGRVLSNLAGSRIPNTCAARRCPAGLSRPSSRPIPRRSPNNARLFRPDRRSVGSAGRISGSATKQMRVLYLTHRRLRAVGCGAPTAPRRATGLTEVKGRLAVLGTQFAAEPAGR